MTINISTVKQKPFVTFINLLGHRGNKVSVSTYFTRTIVVMIVAESALAAVRNPGFNTILENTQTWTLFYIFGKHSVPHGWSKIPKRSLTHFCGSCKWEKKFVPFFVVRENFLHKRWTDIILHLVHLCGQAVNITVMNVQGFILPQQFFKCASIVVVDYPQCPLMQPINLLVHSFAAKHPNQWAVGKL